MKTVDWAERLEVLRDREGCASYTELAGVLGVSLDTLSAGRTGKQELSSELKADILVRLDEPIDQKFYESIFPERSRSEVSSFLDKRFQPDDTSELPEDFWVDRLDQLQELVSLEGQSKTDANVAGRLKVSNAEISGIRNGTRAPSIPLKIKILDALTYVATRNVLLELLPRKAAQKFKNWDNLRFQNVEERSRDR